MFNLIVQRIKDGQDNDIVYFSDLLSNDEMGRLSGIIARTNNSLNPKKEFVDCLEVLKNEAKVNEVQTVNELSDEEYRKLFSNNK